MNDMQNDDAFMQALSITRAQAGVRSMTAQEIVAYAKDVAQGIRQMQGDAAAVPARGCGAGAIRRLQRLP